MTDAMNETEPAVGGVPDNRPDEFSVSQDGNAVPVHVYNPEPPEAENC